MKKETKEKELTGGGRRIRVPVTRGGQVSASLDEEDCCRLQHYRDMSGGPNLEKKNWVQKKNHAGRTTDLRRASQERKRKSAKIRWFLRLRKGKNPIRFSREKDTKRKNPVSSKKGAKDAPLD